MWLLWFWVLGLFVVFRLWIVNIFDYFWAIFRHFYFNFNIYFFEFDFNIDRWVVHRVNLICILIKILRTIGRFNIHEFSWFSDRTKFNSLWLFNWSFLNILILLIFLIHLLLFKNLVTNLNILWDIVLSIRFSFQTLLLEYVNNNIVNFLFLMPIRSILWWSILFDNLHCHFTDLLLFLLRRCLFFIAADLKIGILLSQYSLYLC